jgi:thiol-disulfide isomerase/thioredoxin
LFRVAVMSPHEQARCKTEEMKVKKAHLLLLGLVLAGCGSPAAPDSRPTTAAAKASQPPAADDSEGALTSSPGGDEVRLSIVSFDEIQRRIADKRGKVVVIDAWSTSCPPCLAEFHNLVELHRKYGPDRVACISLSFDFEGLGKPEDQVEGVLGFLRQQGATFENLMSNEESDVLYRKFKLAAVPAVFVYDRAGRLRKRFDNEQAKSKAEAFSYAQVGELVAQLLDEAPPAAGGEPLDPK